MELHEPKARARERSFMAKFLLPAAVAAVEAANKNISAVDSCTLDSALTRIRHSISGQFELVEFGWRPKKLRNSVPTFQPAAFERASFSHSRQATLSKKLF